MDLQGRTFPGGLRLLEPVGKGQFGEVWLAFDPERDERVALKILQGLGGAAVSRFKEEFEILTTLHHPHLARVYHFGYAAEADRYFFTSEFCRGKNLFEAVEGRPVSSFEEILVQLLSALDYIHSQGLVHRDLKAQNVLVEDRQDRPFVKLVDFGLAARLQAISPGRAGTLAYMAPEILSKSPKIDHRADLYALGILSLRGLTGKWPFDIKSAAAVAEWHLRGAFPESIWEGGEGGGDGGGEVPRYLRELVAKLLRKKASERFSHARVVLNFLNLGAGGKYLEAERGLKGEVPVEGPLVERNDLMERLQRGFREVFYSASSSDCSSVFFVTGEVGIGKSRILEEMRHFLELKEVPILEIACDRKIPTWPRLASLLDLEETADRFDPQISFEEEGPPGGWLLERRIDKILEAVRRRPVCLLIDDLHRAEEETKDLLRRLALRTRIEKREGSGVPLLILATSEESHLDREEELPLRRLTEKGIVEYVRHLLGPVEGVEGVAAILTRYSGGLPLLVAEGLRFLAPYFYRNEPLEDRLPAPRLALLYEEKLASLAPGEREFVQTVALLFRPAAEGELEKILDLAPEEVGRVAARPEREGLLRRREEGGFYQTSSQALALDLIASSDTQTKRTLHERIASGLKKIASASPEELAYHLEGAGRREESRDFYWQAALLQRKCGQVAQAARLFLRAIALSEEGSSPWKELVLETVSLLVLKGSYVEAERLLARLEPFPSSRREELRGWIAFKKRRFTEARVFYREALNLLSTEEVLRRVLLKNAAANVELQAGEVEAARVHFQEALEAEGSLPPEEALKISNNHLGLVLALRGEFEEAIRFFQGRLARLPEGMIPERVSILNALGYVFLQASRYDEAVSYLKKALELSEGSGTYHALFAILGNLTTASLKEAHYAESLAALRKMASYQERFGTARDVAFNWLRQGSVYLILGVEEAARDRLERGERLAREISDPALTAWFLLMEGYWEKEFGERTKAEDFFRVAEQGAREGNLKDLLAWSLYARADLSVEKGASDEAEGLLQKICPLEGDEEFLVRLDLLRVKVMLAEGHPSTVGGVQSLEPLLASLESRCLKGNFRETLWEVYQVWGHWEKGREVIEANAAALPEEFRDRYLNQRSRRRLYDERKEGSAMPIDLFATRLLEITQRLVSEHDPQRLLEFIMDTAIELSGATEGLLLVPDEGGGMQLKVARNVRKEDLNQVRFSKSVAEEVVRTGQPIFSLDVPGDQKLQAIGSVVDLGLRTIACVPLKIRNKPLGVIYLDTAVGMPPLRSEALPMLKAFADQAALGLENALLFEEKEGARRRLERDLSETRKVLEEREEHLQELEVLVSQTPRKTLYPYEKIIGRSKKMEEILKTMDKITNAQVPVFIFGETGTGKELLARALHQNSLRKNRAFVAINCSAFPETILESELFGHMKGAFTGADRDRKGLFEEADGGTLFLDEVADMSLAMQAKVLRAVQEQEVMRVGGRVPIKIHVRLVSASNKDLKGLVREGKFREDLYFRIAGITLSLPPLRERREDIPLLIKHLVEKIRKENGLSRPIRIGREAMSRLVSSSWPGNIRELEQCLTNACLLVEGGEIRPEHLLLQTDFYKGPRPSAVRSEEAIVFEPEKKMEEYEREILLKTLQFCGGNKSEAARRLGLSRLTMHKKIKTYHE